MESKENSVISLISFYIEKISKLDYCHYGNQNILWVSHIAGGMQHRLSDKPRKLGLLGD